MPRLLYETSWWPPITGSLCPLAAAVFPNHPPPRGLQNTSGLQMPWPVRMADNLVSTRGSVASSNLSAPRPRAFLSAMHISPAAGYFLCPGVAGVHFCTFSLSSGPGCCVKPQSMISFFFPFSFSTAVRLFLSAGRRFSPFPTTS